MMRKSNGPLIPPPGMSPKVSVIIPTFNRAEYLAECLDSILHQTLRPFQVIVVNDGSSDRTREVLKPYLSAIDFIETHHGGKPAALNKGLEIVSGDYVWIFDDDDIALPDALERFVAPLESNPRYGFSYSTFFYATLRPDTNRIGNIPSESSIPDLQKRGFLIPLLEGNFLGGAALFARTACYLKVGGFDPALIRSQDYEMAIRIARQFAGVPVSGGPTFYYRQHDGPRGSLRDRFKIEIRPNKWLEYDQVFFQKLFLNLPLTEYLPPGSDLEDHVRQAHLQRMRIMASKLLISEVLQDIHSLARLPNHTAFSNKERKLVRALLHEAPYYQAGNLYCNHPEFFNEIRRLSCSSQTVRQFRREVFRAIISRLILKGRWIRPAQVCSAILRAARLYWPLRNGISFVTNDGLRSGSATPCQ
jgi:glycosyltransferase involved in cell wall biosynthesis